MSSCARLSLSVRRAFRIMMKIPWFYSELNARVWESWIGDDAAPKLTTLHTCMMMMYRLVKVDDDWL